jgi:hypothetical protein
MQLAARPDRGELPPQDLPERVRLEILQQQLALFAKRLPVSPEEHVDQKTKSRHEEEGQGPSQGGLGRRFSEMRKMIAISAYTLKAIVITLARVLTLAPLPPPM